jgi:oligogalacturonide transport system permease protein
MRTTRRNRVAYLYLLPWLLGFALFHAFPIVSSLWYSFTNLRMVNTPRFVGLANYLTMFTRDSLFPKALGNTIIYTLVAVPAKVAFALVIALVLTIKTRLIGFYRTLYYIPSILGGSVVISILWRFLFMTGGFMNTVLGAFGLPAVSWFDPRMALFTVSLLPVWQFGSSMVLFMAGLKNVPQELYEAGRIDGAARPALFRHVTIPIITPIIFFNLVMQMINALQEFTSPFVITGGGPLHATYLLGMKIWEEGFSFSKMGYASAVSWILMLIIMALTVVVFTTSRFWVFYEDGQKK